MTDELQRKFRVVAGTDGFTPFAALATSDPARPDTAPGHVIAEARKTYAPVFDKLEARVKPTLEPFRGPAAQTSGRVRYQKALIARIPIGMRTTSPKLEA